MTSLLSDEKLNVLWLDDLRNPRDHVNLTILQDLLLTERHNIETYWVKTYEEFIKMFEIEPGHWDMISFDNDLGTEKEGRDALNYLEEFIYNNASKVNNDLRIRIHTANPAAKASMMQAKTNIENILWAHYNKH